MKLDPECLKTYVELRAVSLTLANSPTCVFSKSSIGKFCSPHSNLGAYRITGRKICNLSCILSLNRDKGVARARPPICDQRRQQYARDRTCFKLFFEKPFVSLECHMKLLDDILNTACCLTLFSLKASHNYYQVISAACNKFQDVSASLVLIPIGD